MQPYFKQIYGISSLRDFDGNTSEARYPLRQDWLFGVYSINGDRKRPNPQAFAKYTLIDYVGMITDMRGNDFSSREGVLPGLPGPVIDFVGFDPNAYNSCVSNLYDQVRGSMDLLTEAAQAHQARDMIKGLSRGLVDAARTIIDIRKFDLRTSEAMRKGRISRDSYVKEKAKYAANKRLEWAYGWKPLAQTAYEFLEHVTKTDEGLFSFVAKVQTKDTSDYDIRNYFPGVHVRRRSTVSNRVRMFLTFRLGDNVNQAIAGYTSLNPASTAWELVPWSFVVDWAVDIGGYIRNVENGFLYHTAFQSGYVTYSAKCTAEASIYGRTSDGPGRTTVYRGASSGSFARKSRSPMSEAPFPVLPRIDLKMGTDRLLNAAALLAQALSGGSRIR